MAFQVSFVILIVQYHIFFFRTIEYYFQFTTCNKLVEWCGTFTMLQVIVLIKKKMLFSIDNLFELCFFVIIYDDITWFIFCYCCFPSNRSCSGRNVLPWIYCILLNHNEYVRSQEPKTHVLDLLYKVGYLEILLFFICYTG